MNDKYKSYKALAALVTYDPETGVFTWKRREELTRFDRMFNKQFAGRECGRIGKIGYRLIGFRHEGKHHTLLAHRLTWLIVYGKIPNGEIDHINRNRADNRISNLRDVHRPINQRNASRRVDNTSGVTGVAWDKNSGKWLAQASIDGRPRYIGRFTCIREAESAVKAFRAKHGFTESHGESA